MMTSLVLTVMGPDRPGLVKSLSDKVTGFAGNWLESRMTKLEDQFTGIVHLQVPADNVEALMEALRELEALGLQVLVARGRATTGASDRASEGGAGRILNLDLAGPDHPGIVRDISKVLTDLGVSIELLETDQACGTGADDCIFKARARLRVPIQVQTEEICYRLEVLASDLVADISVDDADAY